jgi:hypothetical protein
MHRLWRRSPTELAGALAQTLSERCDNSLNQGPDTPHNRHGHLTKTTHTPTPALSSMLLASHGILCASESFSHIGHQSPYLAQLCLLLWASALANPFSISSGRSRGVGGTSSAILARNRRDDDEPPKFLTESGNSVLLGVRAVTTLRADLLMVSLTVHSRFFAM